MQIRPTLGCKTFTLLVALLIVLSGCSRMNLAYRNLDMLVTWSLNDYLDMSNDQQSRFREQLREHLGWHCRTQLPDYLDALERMQLQVRQGQLDSTALQAHYQKAKQAIHVIAVEVTPTTTQLLRDLDDAQVREFGEALAKDQREREEKYLQPPLPQQVRERAERMQERIEQWTGSTSKAQRQRIVEWAEALGAQNSRWLEARVQWQNALHDAVVDRHQPGFEARIARLLQDRDSFWTEAYRTNFANTEQTAIDLISDLYAMSDEKQRRHIDDRLQDMLQDLGSLDCLSQAR